MSSKLVKRAQLAVGRDIPDDRLSLMVLLMLMMKLKILKDLPIAYGFSTRDFLRRYSKWCKNSPHKDVRNSVN